MKKIIRRYTPSQESLNDSKFLTLFKVFLTKQDLWHFNRRSVAIGTFWGVFISLMPIPFQMPAAAFLALLFRCNLPVALLGTWLSNPITSPVIFAFEYALGARLLGTQLFHDVSEQISSDGWLSAIFSLGFSEWLDKFSDLWYPMLLGGVICGFLAGVVAYLWVRLYWRFVVVRSWKSRKDSRQKNT